MKIYDEIHTHKLTDKFHKNLILRRINYFLVIVLFCLLQPPAHALDWDSPVLIRSTLGLYGNNWELLVRNNHQLCHYYKKGTEDGRNSGSKWYKGQCFGENITSGPAFIQSNYGTESGGKGSFEVIAVVDHNKLCHWYRDNEHYPQQIGAFSPSECFTTGDFQSAPALIHSSYGYLEVIAQNGDQFCHYWRDNDLKWHPTVCHGSNIESAPAFIQGSFGAEPHTNFELVIRQEGKLTHWYRANNVPGTPWIKTADTFIDDAGSGSGSVALIQQDKTVLIEGQKNVQRHFIAAGVNKNKITVWDRNNEIAHDPWKIQTHIDGITLATLSRQEWYPPSSRPALLETIIGKGQSSQQGLELIVYNDLLATDAGAPLQRYSTISRLGETGISDEWRALEYIVPGSILSLGKVELCCRRNLGIDDTQQIDLCKRYEEAGIVLTGCPHYFSYSSFACYVVTDNDYLTQWFWTTGTNLNQPLNPPHSYKGNFYNTNRNDPHDPLPTIGIRFADGIHELNADLYLKLFTEYGSLSALFRLSDLNDEDYQCGAFDSSSVGEGLD